LSATLKEVGIIIGYAHRLSHEILCRPDQIRREAALTKTLIVWDSPQAPSGHAGQVYLWNGYEEADSIHSILRYVEANSESLREKYLSWIHELGEQVIGDTRLIDALTLEPGFSYWWMTLLVEKSLWKSPSITDAIRILALEEIVEQRTPVGVLLVSGNRKLHQVIQELCRSLGIQYRWDNSGEWRSRRPSLKAAYARLPMPLQAAISVVRYLWARWPLRRARSPGWFGGDLSVFFCSYFFNIDFEQGEAGRFCSRYWGNLHALLKHMNLHANWLQLYVPHAAVPGADAALAYVQRFNQTGTGEEFHVFPEAYLSWSIVGMVLQRWLRLNSIYWRLRAKSAFRPKNSRISLWPLLQRDWDASMRGPAALINLLWIEVFDRALRDAPRQDKGFYLCENQAWERAFIHAWRKHGHGELTAVPHATIRFWDLRYFADPRTVQSFDVAQMPQPDQVALNGPAAVGAFLNAGFPKEKIRECEALRYAHIQSSYQPRRSTSHDGETSRLLILTDYLPASSVSMLKLLDAASDHIGVEATYTVKPHPHLMIDPANFQRLHLNVTTEPLEKVLPNFEVAYVANMTSAALDAYLAGLQVIVMLDDTQLNVSPLRGQTGVTFVSTPRELAAALDRAHEQPEARATNTDFFFLDPELPRWSRLLS
jgi:surface carbohydrate biosynthesis protein (TIGR04326 family)